MAKESCLLHWKSGDFIIIRQHIVDMFSGDHCAAVVLDYFEFATNGEIARFARQGETGEPWVVATMPSIFEETTRLYSIRRLQDRIIWLESLGFLRKEQKYPGAVKRYLLDVDQVNEAIEMKRRYIFDPLHQDQSIGQMSDGENAGASDKPSDKPSDKTTNAIVQTKELDAPIRREEEKKYKTPLPPTEILQPNTADLDLEDDVVTFTSNAYSRRNRRAKLDNMRSRKAEFLIEQLRRAESEHTPETFRGALLAYLDDQSDYLREHRWPIHVFLKQVDKYAPESVGSSNENAHHVAPRAQGARAAGREDVSPHPTTNGGLVGLPFAAQEWNRVVTAGPAVDSWTKRDSAIAAAANDPEFMSALPRVLEFCQTAHDVQPPEEVAWLTFRWLLRRAKDSQAENWYKISTGEMNWMRKRKGAGERSAVKKSAGQEAGERYLAKLEEKIAAKKASQAAGEVAAQ